MYALVVVHAKELLVIFEIDEEGLATVVEGSNIKEAEEEIQDAADMCPTGAIVIDE